VNNGLESFEKRRSGNYDLLFMDIQMPVMDGIEATHEILDYEEDEEVPHIPIVALTANALKGDRERFLGEGMDEYITKPIETSELLYVLNKFLSHKSSTVTMHKETSAKETVTSSEAKAAPKEQSIEEKETLTNDILTLDEEVTEDTSSEKKILIAKKLFLESRVLTKVIDNLGYAYDTISSVDLLENELLLGKYDILFSDEDLITDTIRQSNENLAIITAGNTKEEIDDLIKKHRG
jgi:CheY-like chemotaxis protein